ncbi:putative secreted salivary gland peptide [Ixodes scapularis]
MAVAAIVTAGSRRIELFGSGSGNRRNFNGKIGGRAEVDLHRFRNGGRITGYGEGSQSFGRSNGRSFRGRPRGEVGIRMTIPLNK